MSTKPSTGTHEHRQRKHMQFRNCVPSNFIQYPCKFKWISGYFQTDFYWKWWGLNPHAPVTSAPHLLKGDGELMWLVRVQLGRYRIRCYINPCLPGVRWPAVNFGIAACLCQQSKARFRHSTLSAEMAILPSGFMWNIGIAAPQLCQGNGTEFALL